MRFIRKSKRSFYHYEKNKELSTYVQNHLELNAGDYSDPSIVKHPSDIICENNLQLSIPIVQEEPEGSYSVMSLFSGCGGMDWGFERCFMANRKSFGVPHSHITTRFMGLVLYKVHA